jgi:hypothetical protein
MLPLTAFLQSCCLLAGPHQHNPHHHTTAPVQTTSRNRYDAATRRAKGLLVNAMDKRCNRQGLDPSLKSYQNSRPLSALALPTHRAGLMLHLCMLAGGLLLPAACRGGTRLPTRLRKGTCSTFGNSLQHNARLGRLTARGEPCTTGPSAPQLAPWGAPAVQPWV